MSLARQGNWKVAERVSDEDNEVGSDKEFKEDESSSEFDSDSTEFVAALKHWILELDSLGMIALEGGTSSGGRIEGAVDVLQGDTAGP